ncbi:MAG: LacI family DNA-binding transcriptional regulator [Anaerolineae bacterium]
MARRRATSVDVARGAGVNQSTVSRTFSDDQSISSETRARVLEVARKLGYKPNAIARSLITQQTNMVGIVMAGITSPFQPYVLEKFIEKLQGMGRQALVFSAGPDQEVDDILPSVFEYRVDALIITSATLSSPRIEECAHYGIPVILFNRYLPGENVSAVCCDNSEGGRLIADLLLDAGHQRIAYVAGNPYASTNRDREKGFTDRLVERGVTQWLREQAQFNYESGAEAGRRLLQRDDPPDAVFCASDVIALGLIDQARDLGVKIPDHLSVVGFDDIPMAGWSAYSLTTIRQPVNRMIDTTLEMVVERIREPETPPVIKMLPGRLVVRNSARLK